MRFTSLLFVGLLVACPGKTPDPKPVVDAGPMLPADRAWGPEGTPLPPGAITVSAEEVAALLASDSGFTLITKAEQDALIAAEAQRHVDARAKVDALVDAGLERIAPHAIVASPGVHPLPGGNAIVTIGDAGFVVQGADWAYRELATSLEMTASRANREEDYASLYELLADELVASLPAPGELAGLTELELQTAHRTLTHLADTQLTNEKLERPSMRALLEFPGTGCDNHQSNNLYALYDWPLKQFTTPIRNQGDRGTCAIQGIVGGMELRLKRSTGLTTNYSEQELWAVAKGLWFPTAHAYGDGINTGNVLDEMKDTGMRVDAEDQWRYNRSGARIDHEDEERYSKSCEGYEGYCSDTNHQMKLLCTPPPVVLCGAFVMPPGVQGPGTDPVKLKKFVSLWNPIEPENSMASIRAHLNAGHPVTLGFETDDIFRNASKDQPVANPGLGQSGPGAVNWLNGVNGEGGHIVLLVGYISNGQLPEDGALVYGFGGGYFIAKNSWACKGDGGYMYLAYDWVVDQAHSAFAITKVSSTLEAPEGLLKTNKALLTEPGSVKFTVTTNAQTRHVALFGNYSSTTPLREADLAGGAETSTTFTISYPSTKNDLNSYFAELTDQFGNTSATNVVAVLFQIDTTNPEVALLAEDTTVNAPGVVRLHAAATDNTGVTKVTFLRGLQIIGEDFTAPYEMNHTVQLGDTGHQPYVAIAWDASGNKKVSNIVFVDIGWSTPPVFATLSSSTHALPLGGGPVTLTWSAGAPNVTIEPGVGAVTSSGSATVNVTNTTVFKLTASNPAGSITRIAVVVVANVVPDTTAPTDVVLMASAAAIAAPGAVTLTTTATDDKAVTRVEYLRNGVPFAVDTTPADGFSVTVPLSAADVGTLAFTAQAFDAAGNFTPSAPVTVTVTVNVSQGSYVAPAGSDTTDCRTEATPCRTLSYAAGQADGGVVILLDGTYDPGNQGTSVSLTGAALVAKNPGLAVLALPVFMNGGTLSEVTVDRDLGATAALNVTGGTATLTGVRFKGSFTGAPALDVGNAAIVTVSGGRAINLATDTLPSNSFFLVVRGSAQVTLRDGSLDGPGVGPATTTSWAAVSVDGTATLKLVDFRMRVVNRGVRLSGSANLELDASSIDARALSQSDVYGVNVENNPGNVSNQLASITLKNGSRVHGFSVPAAPGGVGIRLTSPAATHHPRATVTSSGGSLVDANGVGLWADTNAVLTLTASSTRFDDNELGGIVSEGANTLTLTSSSVSRNGTSTSALVPHFGGITVPTGVVTLKLRRCEVKDNKSTVTNGATRANSGLSLTGGRGASFDLGRAGDPGANTITGNQVNGIDASPISRVYAAGNVFEPSVQGANATGRYALGTAPCGATTCDVTSGVGRNYQVTNGALRLAE